MGRLNSDRRHKLLQAAAMRGAGRVRSHAAPPLRVEGLESRVLLAAAPVITAPQIFGVHPGTPFIFDVTAAGDRPMTFSAAGLPAGLTLNPQTGMITGSLANPATYDLTLTATNPAGSATENFRIVVGDKIGLTPALGWNSWTIYGGSVTQAQVQAQAAAMAASGLINYGWSYINIDAGWEGGRTATGQPIQANPTTFPNIAALSTYIHSLDLKFGLYTVPQAYGYVGESAGTTGVNIWPDAQQFAAWGVDYLKFDGNPPGQGDTMELNQALQATGRDMLLSISYFGGLPASSGPFYAQWANSFRVGADITDAFLNVLNDGISLEQPWLGYSGPGHFNDADNLELGVVANQGTPHPTNLTYNQEVSQMSIWAMDAAPLLLGCDLTQLDPTTLGLLTNPEVLAVDQDPLGMQSTPVNGNVMIQQRPLADGSTAVELINVSDNPSNITVNFSDLGLSGPQNIRDLWQEQNLGSYSGSFTATVPADGTALVKISAATPGAPRITSQPVNQYADVGTPATFSVAATGAGTLAYQWTKNGVAIAGANGATYTTPATTAADNGAVFHCIVTNGIGRIISYEADLNVRGITTQLSAGSYFYGTTGYYSIQMNASVIGTPMNIDGVPFATGIGTHAPSVIDFLLGGNAATFQAQVGLDNNEPGLAIFQVWLDGVKVYDSGVLTGGELAVPVSVNVQGAQVLQLAVADGGPNNNYDHADWANATITSALVPLQLPTVSGFSRTVTFNTPLSFAASDFTSAFTDLTAGQTLQNIKITTLPAHGVLQLNGAAVAAGQNISAAQIANLSYVPTNGYSGPDSFGWNATDQIGYANVPATVALIDQPPPPPNAPPAAPVVAATASSTTSITVSWTDPSVVPNVALSYTILASTDGVHFSQVATASGGTTALTINGLAAGTTYFYEVAGVNALGNSNASNVGSAITLTPPLSATAPATSLDLSGGFAAAAGAATFNGNAHLVGNYLALTDNNPSENSSFFYNTPQSITAFSTQFDFQVTGTWPLANGFTFVIQNAGLNALGQGGSGLGYGAAAAGGTGGIPNSVALKFDFFSSQGEGTDSTGLYLNGAAPTYVNSIDLSGTGFNLRSYDLSSANIAYNGATLTVLLTDLVTGAIATQQYAVNIPALVGGPQAYVGFTGSDGSIYAYQNITNWKFSGSAPAANPPATPAGLTAIPLPGSAAVSWTAAASASSYTLSYAPASGGPYTTIPGINGTEYTVPGLASGATYYFEVSASNVTGSSANSPLTSATLVPAAPTGLTALPSLSQVSLSWTGSAGATSYDVQYATASGGPYVSVPGITGTSATITGLTNGITYYFVVAAADAGGQGPNSAQTSAVPVLPIPAAPTGLSATPGPGQAALTWNAATYAATYTLAYGTTSGTYTNTLTGITGTSATVTGLAAGTTYYFAVAAANISGQSGNSTPASALLAPGVPAILSTTAGAGQVALTWTAMTGAAAYTVQYGTNSGGPYPSAVAGLTGTATTITGLAAGTSYYFVVLASNASGAGGNSTQTAATLAPPAPGGLTATPGNGQVALSWNAANGATGYTISYGTSNGGPYPTTLAAAGTSATVTGLTNGTTYYFVVSASNAGGTGPNSSQNSATLAPPAPGGLTATPGNGQVALSWNAANGATGYTISYGTSNGGPYPTTLAAAGTSATVTGLTNGSTYYFVVSAANAGGTGPNSSQSSATLAPPAPGGLTATPGNGQVALTWNAANGATGYTISYGTASGGPYPTTLAAAGTSATVTGLTNGSTYYFVVSAANAGGTGPNSSQSSATLAPPAPGGLTATPGNGQVALSWNAANGATGYTISYGTSNGGPYPTTLAAAGTSATVTGLTNGSTYYFVVSAANAGGTGPNSSQNSATLAPPAPGGLTATPGNGQVALSWNAANGATGYTISYGTSNGGPYPTTLAAAGTSATVTGLTNGSTYYFVVSAANAGGTGPNSSQSSATLAPPAPGGLTATPGNGQVALTWNAANGATGYTISYGTASGGPYPTTLAAAGTSATVTGLTNGTTYYFVVSASNAGGTSANSTPAAALPQVPAPAAPTGLTATPGNGQVALSWNAANGATGYTISFGTASGGPYPTTLAAAGTSATVTGLTNGTPYYFVVSASNPGGTSANSAPAAATPVLPIPGAPTGLAATPGDGQVALSWNAVAGATGYTISFGTASGGPYPSTLASAGTSATVAGLTDGTTYYFVVSAASLGGQSANSNPASALPLPPAPAAPTGLTATPGNGQVALSWNAASGATGYTISYGTASGGPYPTTLAAAGTSATVTGLANGSTYYFVVSAANLGGPSPNSAPVAAAPAAPLPPAAPTGLTLAPGDTQVALSWNAVAGAASYHIKYATSSGGPYATALNVAGTSATVTGLADGTAYYFVVSALNANGEGANSAPASATPVGVQTTSLNYSGGFAGAAPSLQINGNALLANGSLVLTNNATSLDSSAYAATPQYIAAFSTQFNFQITGTWPLADGFTFVIQRAGPSALGQGGGGLGYGAAAPGGAGGIPNSVALKFNVFSNVGEGNNSTGLYANGVYPHNGNLIDLDGTGFNLRSYDLSSAAITYNGSLLTVVLTDLVTGATATQQYTVNIPALVGGTTAWVGFTGSDGALTSSQDIVNWTYSGTGSAIAPPAAPTGLAASAGNGQAALSWNTVAGASSYTLAYGTSNGGPYTNTLTGIAGTSATVTGLANGTPYYFVVWAVNGAGPGASSAQAGATPSLPLPAAPTGLAASAGNGQAALSWNAVAGASSYTLAYGTSNGGPYTNTLTGIAGTSATVTGLANGTPYYFVVWAVNGAGPGATSAQAGATPSLPLPAAPTGLAASAGNGQVALSWNTVAGAASYNVKIAAVSGGPYANLAAGVATTSATITGLTNGTTYYFVVSAVNAAGEGANSGEAQAAPVGAVIAPPAQPANLTATPGNAAVALAWTAVSGASSYTVLYGTTSGGPYTTALTGITAANVSIPGLTNGTGYYFVVSAVNTGGSSPNSAEAAATPSPAATTLNFANGFAGAGGALTINGSAWIDASQLRLTDNNTSEVSSVYASTPQNITSFTTQFDFQITGSWPLAEGFTFVIQRAGVSAVGQSGAGLGYGATSTGPGIPNSVAIKFDVFSDSGEGTDSTGLYTNGATPTAANSIDLTSTGFNLRSYDPSRAFITYNGNTLTVTLTDLLTGATATQNYLVNIPAVIGGNTAWVGFTASDGSIVSNQTILNWTYATG